MRRDHVQDRADVDRELALRGKRSAWAILVQVQINSAYIKSGRVHGWHDERTVNLGAASDALGTVIEDGDEITAQAAHEILAAMALEVQ